MDHFRRRTHAWLAIPVAVIGLVGCGAGDEVPVPGADAVVTATAPPVDPPPLAEPPTTDAAATTDTVTGTSAPRTTAAPAASTTDTAPATTPAPPAVEPPATEPTDDDVFLRLGDEGPEVAAFQAKLASIDYLSDGFETGVFDEATRLGLRRFQGDYGLGVDGIFGPITGRALNAAVSSINPGG